MNDAGDCWNVSVEGVIPKLSSVNHHLMESGGVEYFTIGKTAGEQTPQSDPHELPVGNPDNKLAF